MRGPFCDEVLMTFLQPPFSMTLAMDSTCDMLRHAFAGDTGVGMHLYGSVSSNCPGVPLLFSCTPLQQGSAQRAILLPTQLHVRISTLAEHFLLVSDQCICIVFSQIVRLSLGYLG